MDLSILNHTAKTSTTALRKDEPDASTTLSTDTSTDFSTGQASSEVAEQFDTFLNLLTAQIKNQDPLAPMDSTQFVEQLATFSNLELQAKNTALLEQIADLLEVRDTPV